MKTNRPFVRGCVLCIGVMAGWHSPATAQTVVRIAPIVRQTPTPGGSEQFPGTTPPPSASRVDSASTFYIEIWASNVGAPLGGLACVHVDVLYDRTDLIDSVSPVQSSPLFPINAVAPVFNDAAGRVDDVGGCQTVPAINGLGVGEWVLVERIEMSAVALGGPITVSLADNANPFAGTSIIGQLIDVDPANIDYQTRVFDVADCSVDPDCDDGVGCTVDACVAGSCVNTPTASLCDNGLFCDGVEVCDAFLDCQPGTPVNCDDGVSCTVDSCNEVNNNCVSVPNNSLCNNGLFCDGVETCDPVLDCQAGTPPNLDDGVVCTDDSCDEVNDVVVHTPNNANCDNGQFCDGAETCDPLLDCQAGVPPSLDDGVACTDDSCDEVNDVIVHTPNDANCDNGQFCDGAETCDALLDCQAGVPPGTDDGVACTDDSCDEANDVIVNTPNDANCDNGQFCDGVETCDALLDCQAGTPPSTDDGVACTDDFCDEVNDVIVNTPNDANCDNGQFCDGIETCDALLGCQSGIPINCDDGVACTTSDVCDEVNDVCVSTPSDAFCDNGLFCDGAESCDPLLDCQAGTAPGVDDGVACTDDSCDEVNDVVVHTPNDANCDNGLFCDGAETCDALLDCQLGSDPCPGLLCDEVGDACVNCLGDGDCDDGLFCNGVETCVAGNCLAGTPVDCGDGVPCTVDTCDEINDVCVNTPTDALCDDGLFCDGVETCDALLGCLAGTPVNCDDGVACTTGDTCDEVNDTCVNTPDDALCDDALFCNGVETCDALLGCQAGVPVNCDDGVGCTADTCDETNDVCLNIATDGLCDNGQFCDGVETCDALLDCQPGTPLTCDDAVGCTIDSCDEFNDVCLNTPTNALCGNGQFCDGVEVCDPVLDCQPGAPVDCDDGVACTVDGCDEVNDVCVSTANNALCNNGLFCDGAETCDPVLGCRPTVFSCNDGEECTTDSCNEAIDSCVFTPIPGCQSCVDDIDCDDGNSCTVDTCSGGVCVVSPNDLLCDNGLYCDGAETCDISLGCRPGTPVSCNDGVVCTVDTCNEVTNSCVNTPTNSLCDNGQFCDGVETCDAVLGCRNGTPPCVDGIACTIDACNDVTNTCVPVPVDAMCDNTLYCDGAETCHPFFGCQPGQSPCDDGLSCSVDTCNDANDSCTHTFVDALCDDGDFLNGQEYCDPNLDCQPGEPLDLVRIVAVVRQTPSGLNTTTGSPPAGTDAIQEGSAFVVELWAQQLENPPSPLLFGLCCVFADLDFSDGLIGCTGVVPSPQYASFASGTCASGLVNEVGGCTVNPPLGVTPQWVRVATVNMTGDVPSFGNTINVLPAGTANSICQYGIVPVAQVQFQSSGAFRIGNPCMYDLDGDDCIGPGDMAFFAPCWLKSVGQPEWDAFNCSASDFDCTGSVDPGDLAFFASGWLKCCDDPTIVFPPLPCGVPNGQALPPASRRVVESFGLPYPEDYNLGQEGPATDPAPAPRPADKEADRSGTRAGGLR